MELNIFWITLTKYKKNKFWVLIGSRSSVGVEPIRSEKRKIPDKFAPQRPLTPRWFFWRFTAVSRVKRHLVRVIEILRTYRHPMNIMQLSLVGAKIELRCTNFCWGRPWIFYGTNFGIKIFGQKPKVDLPLVFAITTTSVITAILCQAL